MAAAEPCFHCALPVPDRYRLTVQIDGKQEPVCCPGCKAVAELICGAGMSSYYSQRDTPTPGTGKPLDDATEWSAFNNADMLQAFTEPQGDSTVATIYAAGMYCSACSWLIDSALRACPGVSGVEVNPVTHRVRITFRPKSIGLGDLLQRLTALGYYPQPLSPDDTSQPEIAEQRSALKRLLVASLGMMQVMMFAVGLYAGDYQGIDADMQRFLRLVSFLVTTPVVFYAGRPFFTGAVRGILGRRPGMDVPVALAIGAAYVASVYATLSNAQAVWFDSVTMFIFFLTLGRYLEMRARHRSIDRSVALSNLLPNTTTLIDAESRTVVPVNRLVQGDRVLIRPGESIPADGIVLNGESTVDESLLTGEVKPQTRMPGDMLVAGSVNTFGSLEMQVDKTGVDTALGAISRMSERARYARPSMVQLADRIASYVVVLLLLIAAAVAAFWIWRDADRAFVITLSVLVVTCPCALALATPAAFAAAGSRLSNLRLLLTNGDAIEALAKATHFVFDKTGTLTKGEVSIRSTDVVDPDYSVAQCLAIAAALEQVSTHPLADAFRTDLSLPAVENAHVHVAAGVSGDIDGKAWRLGKAAFALPEGGSPGIHLSCDAQLVATFEVDDSLRDDAQQTLDALRQTGAQVMLLSGDNAAAVERVAEALRISDYHFACSPADKLQQLQRLQRDGARIVMIGDGINDAPVLAGADASIALAQGAQLAQTHADIVMLGESLYPLTTAVRMSKQTIRTVRQNLAWAILYNTLALPIAAAGMVPPWAAALGMSASSLIVVLNALRLNKFV